MMRNNVAIVPASKLKEDAVLLSKLAKENSELGFKLYEIQRLVKEATFFDFIFNFRFYKNTILTLANKTSLSSLSKDRIST